MKILSSKSGSQKNSCRAGINRQVRTAAELCRYIDEVGFLPLFANQIPGFSVEEHTASAYWWSGIAERDPWAWRETLARSGKVVYGKFFHGKAGFVSLKWLPRFANVRRDGYDFDSRMDEGLASYRAAKIMKLFGVDDALFSFEVKKRAGFGKNGEKNFSGVITQLQMETYLCICDFQMRKNRHGEPYGWPIAVYCMPEHLWGYDFVSSAYGEDPARSAELIRKQITSCWPGADENRLLALDL